MNILFPPPLRERVREGGPPPKSKIPQTRPPPGNACALPTSPSRGAVNKISVLADRPRNRWPHLDPSPPCAQCEAALLNETHVFRVIVALPLSRPAAAGRRRGRRNRLGALARGGR